MAHILRKLVDEHASQGSAIAAETIQRIAKLYEIEKRARGKPPPERTAVRQAHAKPIFDELEDWLGCFSSTSAALSGTRSRSLIASASCQTRSEAGSTLSIAYSLGA
ncbi:transposase [uncultured Roseibium sp.]|uniref:IS66 family transposase n=1 Tax=uncultured Roseibium sp. TaxID=1936171 RepID=UPI003216613A